MCGRYVWAPKDLDGLRQRFELTETNQQLLEIEACYNIGPGFDEPVVVKNSPNHIEIMRWGLIPPWAKDIRIGYKMINARAETILEKVSFKRPFKNRRCVVPVSGFYEWQATPGGKVPYYIYPPDTECWGLAGLYEVARDAEGKELSSFTIITTAPNEFMAEMHTRMPVILRRRDYETWLDTSDYPEAKLIGMLKPWDGPMEKRRVSTRVNSVRNQGDDLIRAKS